MLDAGRFAVQSMSGQAAAERIRATHSCSQVGKAAAVGKGQRPPGRDTDSNGGVATGQTTVTIVKECRRSRCLGQGYAGNSLPLSLFSRVSPKCSPCGRVYQLCGSPKLGRC